MYTHPYTSTYTPSPRSPTPPLTLLTYLCPQDYKRRGRKGPGVDIGAMVKLFESYISGMLGGIKVTAISSKISGKVPTEDELVKVSVSINLCSSTSVCLTPLPLSCVHVQFGSLNIVMFVDLVRALHRKRVRTVDAIRRDENDMRFEELVEKGTDWKVVETGFKVRGLSACVCLCACHCASAYQCA